MNICICGGGSLGHVTAGVLASQTENEVTILTRKPEQWAQTLLINTPEGSTIAGKLQAVCSKAQDCIPQADLVLLCLPGYAIEETLKTIRPHLRPDTLIGSIVSSTGFFFKAHALLGDNAPLFGFQRVPFIARTIHYGKSANLLGYKASLAVATENIAHPERLRDILERLFQTPTTLLGHHYEASLTNSNPILHTGRLYAMWKDWNGEAYDRNILFYKEWTDEASQTIVDMDCEFMRLLDCLPVDKTRIPSLLDYYDQPDVPSLTQKIASIPAFANILSPMKETPEGWVPDWNSRYFTEDFPHGLRYIRDLAAKHGVPTPTIDKVLAWGMSKITQD